MDNNKNDLDMKTSHDIQTTLVGIFIVLLGILGLINATSISGILNFTFAVFLGNFYYIGFFFVIFAGFVNIFRRQPLVIRLNLPTIGFLLLVIAVLATSTSITLRALDPPVILTLDNFFDIYKSYFPMMTEIPTTYPSEVGGGIIGYVVVGLFYSILGESGITLGLVITFILGFFFSFEFLWKKLYKLWKKQRLVQMNEKSEFDRIRQTPVKRNPTEVELSRSSDYYPQPVSNTPSPRATLIQGPNRPISENLSSGGLVKARFNNQNNLQSSDKPTINTPISSSTVIKPTPTKLTSGHSTLTKATITIPKITEEIIAEQYSSTSKINVSKDIDSSLNNYQKETITETQTPIYVKPSIDLLEVRETGDQYIFNNKEAEKRLLMINQTFNDLKVNASAIGFQVGPSVTSFDVMLAKTELINSVKMIIPNLSIRLGGLPALLEEIVPGKDISSLQVPNSKVAIVGFREIIDLINSNSNLDGKVIIPFGKTTSGQLSYLNLKEVIHMLVAGTTGSGKTVFMHTLITTILMRHSPEEIRLLIIDPKLVEMSRYSNLPHL
jgi:S-DNA-T family DNA segregation ATPase FtsK/SpoIIIE